MRMDREFCIAYILDDCEDCPERAENRECQTESHCFEIKQKIISDMQKMDKIEQILKARSFTDDIGNACYLDDSERIGRIKEVLESEE